MTIIDNSDMDKKHDNIDNQHSIIEESRKKTINTLFIIGIHEYSNSRYQTVLWWAGANNTINDDFEYKYSLLLDIWSHPCFKPFHNIISSAQYLIDNKSENFIIRLSTSQPGTITFTFRKETIKGSIRIIHSRFLINNGYLSNGSGTTYKNIHYVIKAFNDYFKK